MRLKTTILTIATGLSLLAPAAAFAQSDYGHDNGRREGGYQQDRHDGDRRDNDRRNDYRGYSNRGHQDRDRYGRPLCRMGVFYMRGSYCATHRRVSRDGYHNDRRW